MRWHIKTNNKKAILAVRTFNLLFHFLKDTLKQYKVELGSNHKLTLELKKRIKQMWKEISNSNMTE